LLDHKTSSLPIWRYISKPSVTVHLHNFNKQHLILVESAIANNSSRPSYSGVCEVIPKHFSFKFLWITSDTNDLKVKCFGVTSQMLL